MLFDHPQLVDEIRGGQDEPDDGPSRSPAGKRRARKQASEKNEDVCGSTHVGVSFHAANQLSCCRGDSSIGPQIASPLYRAHPVMQ